MFKFARKKLLKMIPTVIGAFIRNTVPISNTQVQYATCATQRYLVKYTHLFLLLISC